MAASSNQGGGLLDILLLPITIPLSILKALLSGLGGTRQASQAPQSGPTRLLPGESNANVINQAGTVFNALGGAQGIASTVKAGGSLLSTIAPNATDGTAPLGTDIGADAFTDPTASLGDTQGPLLDTADNFTL